MISVNLSPELNAKIVRVLRMRPSAITLYAAARIEDLERRIRQLEIRAAFLDAARRRGQQDLDQALAGAGVLRGVLEFVAGLDTTIADKCFLDEQLCRAQTAAKTILARSNIGRERHELERRLAIALWREIMGPQPVREAYYHESMQTLLDAHHAGLLPAGIGGEDV